ncbi:MAG: hypothetical protein HN703_13010 [Planctomycetaceae bacterium]|nr:hypothetical protein [Planctomycetaceae bacterium]
MSVLSLDVFWKKLAESGLLSADKIPEVQAACLDAMKQSGSLGNQTALSAQWLVRQGIVTLWQAKQLVKGNASGFFMGDYRLLEKHEMPLGGVVYRGRHEPTKQSVSLVPIDDPASHRVEVWTEIVRHVERAAETISPVLSRTWALESTGEHRFIVCEDLGSAVSILSPGQTSRWPIVEAVLAAFSVCRGVAEIHRLGGVHGSISTRVVVGSTADLTVHRGLRLLQYPLSGDPLCLVAADSLRSSQIVSKLAEQICFVPPERLVSGEPVTPMGDVYGIGCLLHTLLTGSPVVLKESPAATVTYICEKAAHLSTLWPPIEGCPEEVQTLLDFMTATDPRRRYCDAAEAADAIAVCLQCSKVSPELPPQRTLQKNLLAVVNKGAAPVGSTLRNRPTKISRRYRKLSTLSVSAVMIFAVMASFSMWWTWSRYGLVPSEVSDITVVSETPSSASDVQPQGIPSLVDEQAFVITPDDSLPWMPPSEPTRLLFRYLPPGSQLIFSGRPADFLESKDGQLVLKAGGDVFRQVVVMLERLVKSPLSEIETLQVSWQADENGMPLVAIWAHRSKADSPVSIVSAISKSTTPAEVIEGWLRWYPRGETGSDVVIATPMLMDGLVMTSGAESELPRSMRPLRPILDGSRHLTVLGSPHYFVHDGRVLLPAMIMPLLDPIAHILGDDCPAAAVSMHLDDRTYFELDAVSPAVGSARSLKQYFENDLRKVSKKTEALISGRDLDIYGRLLVIRLPELLRLWQQNIRVGAEGRDLVVANSYLPEMAAHNIVLAGSLLLEQISANPDDLSIGGAMSMNIPESVVGNLQKPVTLAFDSDSLETAVEMLSEATGVTIEIAGKDLELQGITKNQSFGLSERGRSGADVLLTILQKSEGKPGQLVYVFRKDGEHDKVVITTKISAQQRGEQLPEVFQ